MLASLILIAYLQTGVAASDPSPQILSTDPVTNKTDTLAMKPLSSVPASERKGIAKFADSLREALERNMKQAGEVVGTPMRIPSPLLGSSLRGARLLPGGSVEIAVDTGASDQAGRLAWALWFQRRWSGDTIQFSLDPEDVHDFRKGNKTMYNPEEGLAPFAIGRELYEADMDLKLYSLGYERDGWDGFRRMATGPAGWRDHMAIRADLVSKGRKLDDTVKARIWIVCDTVYASASDSAIRIDSVRTRVHVRRIAPAAGNKYVDIATGDEVNLEFAKWFESNYEALAKLHPELAAVRENAKALALARWITKHGPEIDNELISQLLPRVDSQIVHGPALMRQDTIRLPDGKGIQTLKLVGGVEVAAAAKIRRDPHAADWVADAAPKNKSASSALSARAQASIHQGAVRARTLDDSWIPPPRKVKKSGVEYELSARGMPLTAMDEGGVRRNFGSRGNKITAASALGPEGPARLEHRADGSVHLEYEGRTRWIQVDWDPDGKVRNFWVYQPKVRWVRTEGA